MTRKFIDIAGLHNVFIVNDETGKLDTTKAQLNMEKIDRQTTLYIMSDSCDVQYGYPAGKLYIWTDGKMIDNQ